MSACPGCDHDDMDCRCGQPKSARERARDVYQCLTDSMAADIDIGIIERAIAAAVAEEREAHEELMRDAGYRLSEYRQRCDCRAKMSGSCPSCQKTLDIENRIGLVFFKRDFRPTRPF